MSRAGALDLTPVLDELTDRERILVESRLRGLTLATCAQAAGIPLDDVRVLILKPHMKVALSVGKEICEEHSRVTRERVSGMLIEAYNHADTATEMVLAARELAKLHGLNAPTEVHIDHNVQLKTVRTEADLRRLSLSELERLAHMRGSEVLEGEFTPMAALPAPEPEQAEKENAG